MHPAAQDTQAAKGREVVVTDVDISFPNMVGLLVKLAFAAIPAILIIVVVVVFLMAVFGAGTGFLTTLLQHSPK